MAWRYAATQFDTGARDVAAADTVAGRVLPVDVADYVSAPDQVAAAVRDVEPCFQLRQPRGLAVSDLRIGEVVSYADKRPRALHDGELELHGHRLGRGAQGLIQGEPGGPPTHHSSRAPTEP